MPMRLVLGLIVIFLFTNFVEATKKSIPPTEKDLVGVWIGYEEGQMTFTRLDLRNDSTGYCARISAGSHVVDIHRIRKWSLRGWDLSVDMTPMSPNVARLYLKGWGGRAYLQVKIGTLEGNKIEGKWNRTLVLSPESEVERCNQETKRAIEEAQK